MRCDEVRERLSPWLDGELDAVAAEAVEAHLLECDDCNVIAVSVRAAEAKLSEEFAAKTTIVESVVSRVITAIDESAPGTSMSPRDAGSWTRTVGTILLAMAIGFLFAVLLFQPWRTRERIEYVERVVPLPVTPDAPAEPIDTSVARFVVATGPISVRSAASDDWSPVPDLASFACPSDAEVRTGAGSRAELETVDGCVIRLNDETQLTLKSGRSVELDRGEIWCSAPDEVSLEVRAGGRPDSDPAVLGKCVSGTSLWGMVNEGVRVTTAEGDVAVHTSDGERRLGRGESVVVRGGNVVPETEAVDPLLATGWMHPLLVEKGGDDPELRTRIDAYLARVGFVKVSYMYENEIRCLGEHAALPLLRFVQSPISEENPGRRHRAVAILADVATVGTIGDLIGLLGDEDPEIRVSAARGLVRLTARSMGRPPEAWRASAEECAPTRAAWAEWWRANRAKYPMPTTRGDVDSGRRSGPGRSAGSAT